jgi:hypothetical protein
VIRTGNCLEMDNLQSDNYNFEQNVACQDLSIRLLLRGRIRDKFYVVRDPTLIDSILLGSFLVFSAALLSTHASVSHKPRHLLNYDTV